MRWLVLIACVVVASAAAAAEQVDPAYPRLIADVQQKLPARAVAVFDGGRLSDFRLIGQGPRGEFSLVPVENQLFARAIKVKVNARTPNGWDVQILTPPTTQPVSKGDRVMAVLNVRSAAGAQTACLLYAFIQGAAPTWAGLGMADVAAGPEWRRFYILGQAGQDFAAGKYDLSLHLGLQAQTLEIGGVAMFNLGSLADISRMPFTPISYAGQEPDAPWRKTAAERIDKFRKGDLTVCVVDKAGQPVPNAKVRVQMQRHAFGFGTFLECELMNSQGPDADKLREWTLKLFNRCTTPIYWADWGWASPRARAGYLKCAQWAADHKLATRGHCIIYPGWKFLPRSIKPLAGDPAALRKRLLEQVVEVTEATSHFNFTEYDVTNELRDLREIHGLLGKDAVAEWFAAAREHAPKSARMAINENTILTRGGFTQAEQDDYAQWIQYLIDRKAGPDVIGMQGHFGELVTGPQRVIEILDHFTRFNRPIHITEFDINTRDEAGQARYTRDFLTAVFSHPAAEAFTMWGFWEGRMWQPAGAMIRKDWTLKPNGQAWMDLVHKEWRTDVTLTTGPDGSCSTRGFLGDYAITAGQGGSPSHLKLTKAGAKIRIEN